MLLTMVGDESHDEREERVFAVAALMAPEDIWTVSELWWDSILDGETFHSARFESEFAYDKTSDRHPQRLEKYKRLTQMVATCGVMGVGVAVDLAAYRDNFPGTPRESAYLKCFTEVIAALVGEVHRFNAGPEGTRFTELRFIFDERRKSQHVAGQMHAALASNLQRHDLGLKLHEIEFQNRQNSRIQMADLVARETMKVFDNELGPTKRPMRKSMEILDQCGRFVFTLLTRDHWEDMKRKLPEAMERSGLDMQTYTAWLGEHRLVDNWSNRIEYVRWLEARDEREQK
jgi:hypothetical protein